MPQRTLTEGEFNAIKDALLRQAPDDLSEQEFDRWFQPRFAGAIGEAEHSPAPVSGSALRRFMANAGAMVNPVTMAQGVMTMARHPMDAYEGMVEASRDQYNRARDAYQQGHYVEAAGHGIAGTLPILGPAAASAGEQIAAGDVAGGLGTGAGLLLPIRAAAEVRAASAARLARKARAGVPAVLERQAADQVAQRVLAPGNPKFKGKAQAIAPDVLRRPDVLDRGIQQGRAGLSDIAEEGQATAGQAIDDAIQRAGGPRAAVQVDPVIMQLQRRIDDLAINGVPIKGAEGRVAGLRARIDQLQHVSRPTNGVGSVLDFDALRRFRDEQYRIAEEAKAYQRMGNPALNDEGFAAAETGSAIRQRFATQAPSLAEANADYTFYKTLGDVLDPVQGRPKVTAPTSGVTGGSAVSGAVAGLVVHPAAGFVLSVVRPWLQKMRSEPAWQLADAQTKMRLAAAIRAGDIPRAQRLMVTISEGVALTSPTESRTRTTEAGPRALLPTAP